MKKSLLALAALTAFAGAASAQSSVTLFGVVDMSAKNVTNSTASGSISLKSLGTDGIASSRLGFRGVEDIGGGMRAGFWLEAGVNPDIGGTNTAAATAVNAAATSTSPTVSQFFNRRSTLSLMGGFGEIRLGRDYTPDFWNHTVYDPFGTNGVGSSVNTFGTFNGAGTLVRANNSVGYFLPAMGGVFGQVMVSAGERVRAPANKHVALRVGYAGGPVSVAVSYGKTDVDTSVATVTDGDWTRFNVGGSFKMGPATLMAQYNTSEGSGGAQNGAKIAHFVLGGTMGFGASTLKASYVKSDGKGTISTRDATQIALGYQYDLSKRSAVYATYARIANDGSATYAIGGGTGAPAAGKDSTGYEFGIRHTF
jgi:predicted porin